MARGKHHRSKRRHPRGMGVFWIGGGSIYCAHRVGGDRERPADSPWSITIPAGTICAGGLGELGNMDALEVAERHDRDYLASLEREGIG